MHYVHERDWTVWWICDMQILDLSSAPSWDGPRCDRLCSTWEDEIAMILFIDELSEDSCLQGSVYFKQGPDSLVHHYLTS